MAPNVNLPILNRDFLARRDVFVMNPDTPGGGGSLARWPEEVLDPLAFGKRYLLFEPGDYSGRGDSKTASSLIPRSGGTSAWPAYYLGVPNLADQDLNLLDPAAGSAVVFPAMTFHGRMAPWNVSHVVVCGVTSHSPCVIRTEIRNVTLHRCRFLDVQAGQPIRIRFGAENIVVSETLIARRPPFATAADAVGIQFVDGLTTDCKVINSVILNYTDAIQTTLRTAADGSSNDYGNVAGLLIEGSHLGFTGEVRTRVGGNIEGCENVLDLKTGGTPANPVIVRNNTLFGCRPNRRTPGYAIVIQNLATDLVFENNLIVDHECGVFLNAQYVNNVQRNGWQVPRARFARNVFAGIHDHQVPDNAFAHCAGCLIVGLNSAAFHDNTLIGVDRWAASPPTDVAGPLIAEGTKWFDRVDPLANSPVALPAALVGHR